jgi:hypothetical protein
MHPLHGFVTAAAQAVDCTPDWTVEGGPSEDEILSVVVAGLPPSEAAQLLAALDDTRARDPNFRPVLGPYEPSPGGMGCLSPSAVDTIMERRAAGNGGRRALASRRADRRPDYTAQRRAMFARLRRELALRLRAEAELAVAGVGGDRGRHQVRSSSCGRRRRSARRTAGCASRASPGDDSGPGEPPGDQRGRRAAQLIGGAS